MTKTFLDNLLQSIARSVRPSMLLSTVCSCVVRTFVRERGGGEGRRKIRRKNGGPSTLPTAYYFYLCQNFYLWLTDPIKDEGWKDEGYYHYLFSSILASDGKGSTFFYTLCREIAEQLAPPGGSPPHAKISRWLIYIRHGEFDNPGGNCVAGFVPYRIL
jgi:hypothetical protein